MTKDQISAFCIDHVADILRIPKESIDMREDLALLGLDSAMAVYLVMELEDKLNLDLDYTMLTDYPTIEQLAAYLAEKFRARSLLNPQR